MMPVCGIAFTVCNRLFPSATHKCPKQLIVLGIRLCHHGNNGRRPQAVVDAINVQAHRKSSRTDTKVQYLDVIKQLNDVLFGSLSNISARNSLESRLGTLESLGCSMNDIQEYPQILRLTENEIILRAQRLKRMGVNVINVESLKAARFKSDKTVAQKLQLADDGRITQEGSSTNDKKQGSFCDLLQCSPEELQALRKRNPYVFAVRNYPKIEGKVRILQEYGATLDIIKRNPGIFSKSLKTLNNRLIYVFSSLKIKKLTPKHLGYISLGVKDFHEAVELNKNVQHEHQDIGYEEQQKQRKLQDIANLLDVDVSEISDIKLVHSITVEFATKKINYLLGLGIEKRDIVNHFYFLNNSLAKMEKVVEMALDAGIQKPSLVLLVNILQHKCVPRQRSHARQLYTVATLLDIPKHFIISKRCLRSLGFASRLSLKKNLLFLTNNGFSKQDILSCPLVLGHDPDDLVSCYESLPDRLDCEIYAQVKSDTVKMINVLQYYMELDTDMNCENGTSPTCKESICDGTDLTEPSDCTDILVHDD